MSLPARHRSFTILELMVVAALLAIIMAMTVPRLFSQESRTFQLAADKVADLLMMFAQRETMATRPVGVWHDSDRNWIVLSILDIDQRSPDEPAEWRPDRTVAPVKLPRMVDRERGVLASVDGRPVDFRRWPISTAPGTIRPTIEISLFADDGTFKTIVLPSHAIAPYQLDRTGTAPGLRMPIDLDELGRYREDW